VSNRNSSLEGGTDRLLDAFEYCASVASKELGVELLLAYGTLLGAIREGDFIKHDDAIFYAKATSTSEACLEFARVVQRLQELGERIRVIRSGQFHWVAPRFGNVDIFMGWFAEGRLFSYCACGIVLSPEHVEGRPFEFKGRQVKVPAAYERILEATYGPGWKVPDPLFQWRLAPEVKREIAALEQLWVQHSSSKESNCSAK
jgi:hypothetical protein